MENQIKEIDNLTSVIWEANHKKSVLDYHWIATEVYKAGYRKASDVAREIFAEIDDLLTRYRVNTYGGHFYSMAMNEEYAELKKKYESGSKL
jgi:hypothetical protein